MNNTSTNRMNKRLNNAGNNLCCPECGAKMEEIERHTAGPVTYVWFSCIQSGREWMQTLYDFESRYE